MHIDKRLGRLALSLLAAAALPSFALADTQPGVGGSPEAHGSAGPQGQSNGAPRQLPHCAVPLNTIALVEDQNPALAQHGLTSPVPVLRLMVQQSNCFTVVDRGQALQRIEEENRLTGGGPMPRLVRAKYFLTPNILFQDSHAGAAGGGLGALLPGIAGLIAGGITENKSQAQVTITVTDTDTGIQVMAAEGSAETHDIGWALGGGGGGFGAIGGAYASTDIGKTVTAALFDAYVKVVQYAQQTQPTTRQSTPVPDR